MNGRVNGAELKAASRAGSQPGGQAEQPGDVVIAEKR